MIPTMAIFCGLGFGAGVALLVDGLNRRERHQKVASPLSSLAAVRQVTTGLTPIHAAGVVVAAAGAGLITRWPVGALLAGLAAWSLPGILVGDRDQRVEQARLEAIATWTESLRDTLAAAAGLEQAIAATAPATPPAIRAEVTALAEAIDSGVRLPVALRAFANDLRHPTGDLVVAALLLAATRQARNLADQLGALAATAREQAAARLRVRTEWATTRTSVRVIITVTLLMAAAQIAVNRDFLTPYDSPAGQLVLLLVGALFATGFVWLARMGRLETGERVLAADPQPEEGPR